MNSIGEKSKMLLANILKCANDDNYNNLVSYISTPEGLNDYIISIRNNHTLSLIFLKTYVQKWIDTNSLSFLYNIELLGILVDSCVKGEIKQGNLVQLADYIEILSNNYLIPYDIISTMINHKLFILVDAVFKKYTHHQKSNRLFTEIKATVPLFFPVFTQLFFNPAILTEIDIQYQKVVDSAKNAAINSNNEYIIPKVTSKICTEQEYILSIFYSLIFQDISPAFEDNIEHFFKIFFILFDQNQRIINQIFELLITKYPEMANFELIILTLSRYNSLDGSIVKTLTKAYSTSKCYPNVIINFLQRNLIITMDSDWLSNTRNFIKGNDIQRGVSHQIIRLLNCSVYLFKDEPLFFVATVLKYKDADLVNRALGIVNTRSSNIDLVFSAFAYLISVKEYNSCCIGYLETDLKFICMKYLSSSIKAKDCYHYSKLIKTINSGQINHSDSLESLHQDYPLMFLDSGRLLKKTVEILQNNLDEFSSDLLFRLVKNNGNMLTIELYNLLTHMFTNIHVISSLSLNYLFEIYILLGLKLKKYNLNLIETILNKEIVDIYNLCFYYTSILLQEVVIKESFILYILSQTVLWNTKELRSGLSCLLISAYKKQMIKKEQVEGILGFLDGFERTFVLSQVGIQMPPTTGLITPEDNYLIFGIYDLNYFNENFLQRKYARMIVKKMIVDKVPTDIIQKIIEKNKINIEFETLSHTISIYFDI